MRRLRRGWSRLVGTVVRRDTDDELAQEIESHIEWLAREPCHSQHGGARRSFGRPAAFSIEHHERVCGFGASGVELGALWRGVLFSARRRNELGVRVALGATRARLLGLVIRQGMTPVIVGLMVGVAAALLAGRVIRDLLFEIQPGDPATIG